jgi:hypothetical protein
VLATLLPLLAAGCGAESALGPAAVAGGGSVVLIGRTPVDVLVSAVQGQDCSIVRLDRGESYCAPPEAAPPPEPFCTRSLGSVDCWESPPKAEPAHARLADRPPTPPAPRPWWSRRSASAPAAPVAATPAAATPVAAATPPAAPPAESGMPAPAGQVVSPLY